MGRAKAAWKSERIRAGNLDLDPETLTAHLNGQCIRLTPQEYHLLALLAGHAGMVLPNSFIAAELWESWGNRESRRLSVLVSRLRALVKDAWPYQLQTVRNRGYGLVVSDCAAAAQADKSREPEAAG